MADDEDIEIETPQPSNSFGLPNKAVVAIIVMGGAAFAGLMLIYAKRSKQLVEQYNPNPFGGIADVSFDSASWEASLMHLAGNMEIRLRGIEQRINLIDGGEPPVTSVPDPNYPPPVPEIIEREPPPASVGAENVPPAPAAVSLPQEES